MVLVLSVDMFMVTWLRFMSIFMVLSRGISHLYFLHRRFIVTAYLQPINRPFHQI